MDLKLASSHSVINEASPPEDLTYLVKKYNLVSNTVTIYMAKKIKLIVVVAVVVINSCKGNIRTIGVYLILTLPRVVKRSFL